MSSGMYCGRGPELLPWPVLKNVIINKHLIEFSFLQCVCVYSKKGRNFYLCVNERSQLSAFRLEVLTSRWSFIPHVLLLCMPPSFFFFFFLFLLFLLFLLPSPSPLPSPPPLLLLFLLLSLLSPFSSGETNLCRRAEFRQYGGGSSGIL